MFENGKLSIKIVMEKRWRTGVSNPNVSISIQEYSQEVVDQWIREIGDVARKLKHTNYNYNNR